MLAVRAGHLPAAALRSALPHAPVSVRVAFADVLGRIDRGERFGDAVAALVDHLGDEEATVAAGKPPPCCSRRANSSANLS